MPVADVHGLTCSTNLAVGQGTPGCSGEHGFYETNHPRVLGIEYKNNDVGEGCYVTVVGIHGIVTRTYPGMAACSYSLPTLPVVTI